MKRMIAILMIAVLCLAFCAGCAKGRLVGKWKETNMGGIFEFKRNGDLLIRDSVWSYRLEGKYLILGNEDGEEGYYTYRIQGDNLTMQDEAGLFTFQLERMKK